MTRVSFVHGFSAVMAVFVVLSLITVALTVFVKPYRVAQKGE